MGEAYVVMALRTAGGRKGGRLKDWHPIELAGHLLSEIVNRSGVSAEDIDDVILGCVSQAGEQSNNIARYAVLAAGLPEFVSAVTVDRQCGSSQQAMHFAAQAVKSGTMDIVIAAGVESMTRVPLGTPVTAAVAAGLGGPMSPRLRARYSVERFNQFTGAEMIARKHNLTRDALDQFSLDSQRFRRFAASNYYRRGEC
jgi:acetyl-CoA C-acetyltransferase